MAVGRLSFLDVIRESRFLEPEHLEELANLPPAERDEPKALARAVLQRGWLTRFQLTMLGQGKGKELVIGPYRLLDRLGEGGMGQVFKAHHQPMNRTVALKVILKERLAKPDAVKRFYREVQAAAQLVHPNIVLAYDAGQAGDAHYFAMEYVEGTDLADLVQDTGPLPVGQACDFTRQAALGLQYAHERGLIHRDIKPANLILAGGTVKVLDFGLARLQGGGAENVLTQTGAVVGTPDYIAPEQALDSKAADIRSDLYSLGCTLYFLLTARAPHHGESLTEVLLKHQMSEPSPLEQVRPDVPPRVAAVVRKLMAKRPEDRYQTPAEVAEALAPLCHSSGGGATGIRDRVPRATPAARRPRPATATAASGVRAPGRRDVEDRTLTLSASRKLREPGRPPGPGKGKFLIAAGGGLGALAVLAALTAMLLATRPKQLSSPAPHPAVPVAVKAGGTPGANAALPDRPRPAAPAGAAADRDQATAEKILDMGGTVEVIFDGKPQEGQIVFVGSRADMPGRPFRIHSVRFHIQKEINEDDLKLVEGLSGLTMLDLSHTVLTASAYSALPRLRGLPKLSHLGLRGTNVDDAGLEHLQQLPELFSIDLASTQVTGPGLAHLRGLKHLNQLTLSGNNWPDPALENLAPLTCLGILDLSENKFTGAGLKHLAALSQLNSLNLSRTWVTGSGLEPLAQCTNLQVLMLEETQISDVDLARFKNFAALQALVLTRTKITDAGLANLKQMANLQTLTLGDTGITDAGLANLKQIPNLTSLGLAHTAITDKGLPRLAELKKLTLLDLTGTPVSDAGMEQLQGFKSLKFLLLGKTRVTEAAAARLRAALPNCNVVGI